MKVQFVDHCSQGYYKPFATRPLVLASLFLITLTLIVLTEYACRNLPNHAGIGTLGNVINGKLKRDLTPSVQRDRVQHVERFESFIPIFSNPLSLNSLFSITSSSGSTSTTSVTTTATGGNLSLGSGSTSVPGKGLGTITTSVVKGGWLSTGDGSTTIDPPSQPSPPSQPTVGSPASNSASQPTSPSVVVAGGKDPPSDPNTLSAAPSRTVANPVQQPTNIAVTSTDRGAGTSTPIDTIGAVVGAATLAKSFTDPVTDSNAAPTPLVVVSNGQTFVETPPPVASGGNPTLVVITSDGQVFTQTPIPHANPIVVTSDGKTFTESPNTVLAPVVFTSDGHTFTQDPDTIWTPVVFVSNGHTFTETATPVVFVSNGKTYTSTPTPDNQVQLFSATPVVISNDGYVFTETPVIVISNGHTFTSTPTYYPTEATSTNTEPAIKPMATVVNGTGTFLIWPGGESTIYPQITLSQYTLVAFVPLLLAVIYTIPFRILDRTIREMEPFYQLHHPGGALAEHSLCLDYATSNAFLTPFIAGLRGHAYMFWSGMMSLAVVGIAPLSSEAFFVSLSGAPGVYGADITVHEQDYASWGVYPVLARLIEGLLSFVAVLIVFMIWSGRRRESGVFGDPSSIAGLATLLHSSPLLRVFREINSMVSNSELKKILAGQRYRIGEFVTAEYRACHGLLPADSESGVFIFHAHKSRKGSYRLVEGGKSTEQTGTSITSSEVRPQKSQLSELWERIKEKLLYGGILVLNTGMLTLICYYHWSSGDIHHGFEHFMDSGGFGVRFMMTALGVVLKMFWSNLDQDLRRQAPYTRMSHASATPLDSILIPSHSSPLSALPSLLRQKHLILSTVAILSIFSEFLPICLANITFSAATTELAYETCNDISLIILTFMFISMWVLILKPNRGVKRLPRSPNTVGSVLLYLAAAGGAGREREGLLDSVKGMERLNTEEMNDAIRRWGRSYALGEDKEGSLRVDEVERIQRLWME